MLFCCFVPPGQTSQPCNHPKTVAFRSSGSSRGTRRRARGHSHLPDAVGRREHIADLTTGVGSKILKIESNLDVSVKAKNGDRADVAQTAEQLTCNQQVAGSTPAVGSGAREAYAAGLVCAERYPSGQREQTVNLPAYAFGGSNPPLSMSRRETAPGASLSQCGGSSVGRASAFQAERRGFDSRSPLSTLLYAQVAQSAEHVLGKDEVGGSIPLLGSRVGSRGPVIRRS